MKNYSRYIVLILFSVIFSVSLISSQKFTDIYVLPKQFYFIFSALAALVIFFVAKLFVNSSKILQFNVVDALFLLFSIYLLTHYFVLKHTLVRQEIILYILLVFMYLVIRFYIFNVKDFTNLNILILIILAIGFLQAGHGILQYLGISKNHMEEFKVGGAFGNPGPFTNYLVSIIPLSLGIFLFNKQTTAIDKLTRIFSILSFSSICFVLIVGEARTSWIASFISILLVLNYKYAALQKINQWIKSIYVKVLFVVVILCIGIFAGQKLYSLKKDSSLGRLFIWETTINAIKEKPLFGTGYTSFLVEHNKRQAKYFAKNPDDMKRGYLADNVLFAFNDYLEIALELGIIGLMFFLLLMIKAIFVRKSSEDVELNSNYLLGLFKISLGAILISSLFSYPLNTIPILVNFVFFIAVIAGFSQNNFFQLKLNNAQIKLGSACLIILLIMLFKFEYTRYTSNLKWTKAARYIKTKETAYALNIYKKVYPVLRYNGNFLYNYGAELSVLGEYNKSLKLLKEAESLMNDADYYSYLGNTYEGLMMPAEAEKAFKDANRMIPHKFYPQYRLVMLYINTGRNNEALELANKVLSMKPKVKSNITDQIIEELLRVVENYDQ